MNDAAGSNLPDLSEMEGRLRDIKVSDQYGEGLKEALNDDKTQA